MKTLTKHAKAIITLFGVILVSFAGNDIVATITIAIGVASLVWFVPNRQAAPPEPEPPTNSEEKQAIRLIVRGLNTLQRKK